MSPGAHLDSLGETASDGVRLRVLVSEVSPTTTNTVAQFGVPTTAVLGLYTIGP